MVTKLLKKILIAEDERPMAQALETKLKNEGFDARAVFDGGEVIKILAKEKYDVLLLDLMMPIKDGFAVLEELKATNNKIPVIVSTNLNQEEDLSRARKLGAKDYFVKSDTPINEVVNRVKKFL